MSYYEYAIEARRAMPALLAELDGMASHADAFNLQSFVDHHSEDICVIVHPSTRSDSGGISGYPTEAAVELLAEAIADMYPEILARAKRRLRDRVEEALKSAKDEAKQLLKDIEKVEQ